MYAGRSHRLRLDRRARILFGALWMAPVAMPLLIATASPWIPREQMQLRPPAALVMKFAAPGQVEQHRKIEDQIRDPARPRTLRVDMNAAPRATIPGSAAIRQASLQAATPDRDGAGRGTRRFAGRHVFRRVEVVDNLRLGADGVYVALAGLTPVGSDAVCKRLDGVMEPCVARAISRLEVLTRGRAVTCDIREDAKGSSEMTGACRADKIDIAEDLIRNGLARRVGT